MLNDRYKKILKKKDLDRLDFTIEDDNYYICYYAPIPNTYLVNEIKYPVDKLTFVLLSNLITNKRMELKNEFNKSTTISIIILSILAFILIGLSILLDEVFKNQLFTKISSILIGMMLGALIIDFWKKDLLDYKNRAIKYLKHFPVNSWKK